MHDALVQQPGDSLVGSQGSGFGLSTNITPSKRAVGVVWPVPAPPPSSAPPPLPVCRLRRAWRHPRSPPDLQGGALPVRLLAPARQELPLAARKSRHLEILVPPGTFSGLKVILLPLSLAWE